jgi:hypothetical protein
MEEIHGSSDIPKVATQAVIFARAYNYISTSPQAIGVPTFIRPVKVRVDGSAQHYTGVGFYDTYKMEYSPYYSVGHLESQGDKWKPTFGDLPAWVDIDRLIADCSEVT